MALRVLVVAVFAAVCEATQRSLLLRARAEARAVVAHAPQDPHLDKPGDWEPLQYIPDGVVSCKGQVFVYNGTDWKMPAVFYDGCGYSRGSCNHPKWSKGPKLHGPGMCNSSERMLQGCSMAAVEDKDRIVVITQPQWGAFYHFLIDSLPRVFWVRDQRPDLLEDKNTFFHTGYTAEAGQAWARLVGIPTEFDDRSMMGNSGGKNRLLDGWWSAKTVVWPPSNGCVVGHRHSEPRAMQGMQRLVTQSLVSQGLAKLEQPQGAQLRAGQQASQPVVLLVRRHPKAARARALLNHPDLQAALERNLTGWKFEVFSDYPATPDVVSTCSMFQRADLIIGPHGAGFANLVCSRAGVPVVEIQQKPHMKDFELVTSSLGLPYFGVHTGMGHSGSYILKETEISSVVETAWKAAAAARSHIGSA